MEYAHKFPDPDLTPVHGAAAWGLDKQLLYTHTAQFHTTLCTSHL